MQAETTAILLKEIKCPPVGLYVPHVFRAHGYRAAEAAGLDRNARRAAGVASLLSEPAPHIYAGDLIAGSLRPLWVNVTQEEADAAAAVCAAYPNRHFGTNADHFTADYPTALAKGVPGLLGAIEAAEKRHAADPDRLSFLAAMRTTLKGLSARLRATAERAEALLGTDGYSRDRLVAIAQSCRALTERAPASFAEALQLVWMIHTSFNYEGRYAMALGRIDQYLYPYFKADTEAGLLTEDMAVAYLENVFAKICEWRALYGWDDVCNIAIGGSSPDGASDVNRLSYCVLWAVRNINRPGPNLSARLSPATPDVFLDECLQSIGTGLGYPALMNDAVNIPALLRYGYEKEDVYNYSMVGCIENFISGMQPPWSDGRFDTPRFLAYIFNHGKDFLHPTSGPDMGDVAELDSMEAFLSRFEAQLSVGVRAYVEGFRSYNDIPDPENYTSPFLSCFCRDCIGRGLDINMGGAVYPSVHGAALMGVGTVCDSLAAIEQVVFTEHAATLVEVGEALKADFEGYEPLREKLLAAPKYGNNDDRVDKYAVWFVDFLAGEFTKYKTRDGGGIYIAMAANTQNIDAGRIIGATPDGRRAGEPLSDAASPTYGRDTRGATVTVQSITKPDYTRVACGTVINQKFSPSMFEDGKRQKLLSLIKVYFAKGGQEMQINATSTAVLRDAMEHPEKYPDLVVRVSGFSALYVTLSRAIQMDILARTQQE